VLTAPAVHSPKNAKNEKALLDQMLDVMSVTDTAYHALHHTQPLAEALLRRVRRLRPNGGRVLLIAPNELLTAALFELGYEVGIWHVTEGSMSDELCRMADRCGSLDDLFKGSLGSPHWDLILLPYVLEATRLHPAELLQRLRKALAPEGRLVVAYQRVGGLEVRLNGLRGRALLPDPYLHLRHISLSWPNLGCRRRFGSVELEAWCALVGFGIESESFELDKQPTIPIDAMSIRHWLGAHARSAAKRAFPSLRDVGVATLAPLFAKPSALWKGSIVSRRPVR
jgi:SAM-dependent methyltransferase